MDFKLQLRELLNQKIATQQEKARLLRLQIVHADGPKESSGISNSRWDLEAAIEIADQELTRLWQIDNDLKKTMLSFTPTTAQIGCLVKFEIDGKESQVLLTNSSDDISLSLTSASSPIGKAILGKQPGDTFTITTPNGPKSGKLVSIST